jgi:hypothetical protein
MLVYFILERLSPAFYFYYNKLSYERGEGFGVLGSNT